jgi:hypothetical protein
LYLVVFSSLSLSPAIFSEFKELISKVWLQAIVRGWVVLRPELDGMENLTPSTAFKPWTIYPTASQCTNYSFQQITNANLRQNTGYIN